MEDFNSKYTGEQVEELLDMVANGEVGGGIEEETDPIFSASPAASITDAKKAEWDNKVDKVNGKQLSTEDFTTALKTKLEGLNNYDDTELSNALATLREDFDKLVSGDTTTAIKTFNEVIAFLDGIADTEDLAGIIASIEQQIASKADTTSLAKVATSGSYNDLSNKPTIPAEQVNADWNATSGKAQILNKPTIPSAVTESTVSEWGFAKSSALQTKAEDSSVVHKTGNETISGAKTFNSGVNFLGSGDSNAVTLSTNTRININGTNKTVLGFGSGTFYINHADYTLLLRGKATRPTYNGADMALSSDVTAKQDKLVSGTNIKTINGTSILGSGDVTIEGGGATLTEADIAAMGFTKNTGTYSKPSGGIPKSDLSSEVQTSLGKADTALQSYTEQYKGTITGVSANGTSVATSGVANIPAASTSTYGVTKLSSATNSTSTTLAATASAVKSAYDLANSKQAKLVSGTNIKTINGTSILGSGNITISGGGGGTSGGGKEFVEIEPLFEPAGYTGSFDINNPLQPNKVYVFTEAIAFLYCDEVETSSVIGDEYTIMFTAGTDLIPIYFEDIGLQVYWVNGAIPPISEGDLCELSLVRIGSNLKAVLTTFKPVD